MKRKLVVLKRIEDEVRNFIKSIEEKERLQLKNSLSDKERYRLKEVKRLTEAIETVFNLQNEEMKKLIQLRYWSSRKLTWDAVATYSALGRTTVFRWRKEFLKEISNLLGW